MAQRPWAALRLLQVLCVCHLARAGAPVVLMQNHHGDVLEGDDVTLECLSNNDENMGDYVFQKYSKWMKTWVNLDKTTTIRCWYYDVNITREDERLQLYIKDIQPWQVGPYRCVNAINSSFDTQDNDSETFTIPFKYVQDVEISLSSSWCGTVGTTELVDEGSDVELRCYAETDSSGQPIYEWSREGQDWIVASNILKLKKIGKEDSGTYTCQARHSVIFSLVKTKSLELKVVTPAQGWTAKFLHYYTPSSTSGLLAMFIGIPAGVLLLFILVISLVIRRRMAINRKKALIAEPEQRSPIYKGSQESLPSRTGDTQPLVI